MDPRYAKVFKPGTYPGLTYVTRSKGRKGIQMYSNRI